MAAAKQHLDFLNIMSYDYHGSWDAATNFMAPWSDPAVGSLVGKLYGMVALAPRTLCLSHLPLQTVGCREARWTLRGR